MAKPANEILAAVFNEEFDSERYKEIASRIEDIIKENILPEFENDFTALNEGIGELFGAYNEDDINAGLSKLEAFKKLLHRNPAIFQTIFDYYKGTGYDGDFESALESLNQDFELGINLDYLRQGLKVPKTAAEIKITGVDRGKYYKIGQNFESYNDLLKHRFDEEFSDFSDALRDIGRSSDLSKDRVNEALSKLEGIERTLGRKPDGQDRTDR